MHERVILLKNKTRPKDAYCNYLNEYNYEPVFVPLIKHSYIPSEAITLLTDDNYFNQVDSLILTSQRAVECLEESIIPSLSQIQKKKLLKKTVYTVGPATEDFIKRVGFTNVKGGINAGNGSVLADIIINDLKTLKSGKFSNFLFFVGEVRKDIIPKKLALHKDLIQLKELIIYKTEELDGVLENFEREIYDSKYVVFFSPQGTKKLLPFVKENHGAFKVITIGPTTKDYLISNGINVDMVCEKPEASSLVKSVQKL
ncbi:uroporphyrinogen-III synthase HEM4 SCDLUD_002221 [Saccharomycodes ludwigii]|uniref:uroporphyrinogen-III synthase HEM4 n=1 Tax=Saccharomycodes ludwigii TaxID=36035 RepID=UPI001E880382|nr:hypothetical protein SCDLUD_002221 [Saccharomycodes ludwigii]KAH3902400.1 hypothetical protein SCDLUD_002221 [Saccharomycodes ludwigii]